MISIRLGVLFALELVAAVLVGALVWGISIGHVPVGAILVILVALGAICRVGLVLIEFVFAQIYHSPREPESQVGPSATLVMVVQETLYFLMVMVLLMPFARRLVTPRRGMITTSKQLPVLFIHGYACNKGVWAPMLSYLWWRGLSNLYTLDLSPRFGNIEDYVDKVAARIDRICEATRAQKVVLVGHSMGGLVARAYIDRHGTERVAKIVSIASPHHGTMTARFSPGANSMQMRVGSRWLDDLNRNENLRSTVEHVCIYSPHDNVVIPQSSAELGAARNIELKGKGHFALVFCKEGGQLVYREIVTARSGLQAA